MPAILFDVVRTGDLSRPASVDWALQPGLLVGDLAVGQATSGNLSWVANETVAKQVTITTVGNSTAQANRSCTIQLSNPINLVLNGATATTVIIDDDAAGPVPTPAGYPYPRSLKYAQITFPTPINRILATSDQHPSTAYADSSLAVLSCDRNTPRNSSMEVNRLTGAFPSQTIGTARAAFGIGTRQPNLKAHAVLSLPNQVLLVYFYYLSVTNGFLHSSAMVSTDDGATFPTPPSSALFAFDVGSNEQFQPRGLVQLGPGYGAAGSPLVGAPQHIDRNYVYLVGNNQTQGSVFANRTRQGGLIYLCRYKIAGTGGSLSVANLNTRSRYSFFTGLNSSGVPTWTPDGGLKTASGVVPIFRNIVDGANVGVGYFFQLGWHAALNLWVAAYTPGPLDGVAIAVAPTLWDASAWRMLCYRRPVAGLSSLESGWYMGCSAPAVVSSATRIGLLLATYNEDTPAGDDLILAAGPLTLL